MSSSSSSSSFAIHNPNGMAFDNSSSSSSPLVGMIWDYVSWPTFVAGPCGGGAGAGGSRLSSLDSRNKEDEHLHVDADHDTTIVTERTGLLASNPHHHDNNGNDNHHGRTFYNGVKKATFTINNYDDDDHHEIPIEDQEAMIRLFQETLKAELEQKSRNSSSSNHDCFYDALGIQQQQQQQRFIRWFLQAEQWDLSKACVRFLDFEQAKQTLFGISVPISRSTFFQDLDPENVRCLQSGIFQRLPCVDRGGQMVLLYFPNHKNTRCTGSNYNSNNNKVEHMIKAWWYFCMAQLEDNERWSDTTATRQTTTTKTRRKRQLLQRKPNGVVLLIYHVGSSHRHYYHGNGTMDSNKNMDENLYWRALCRSLRQLPLRVCEMHYCFDNDNDTDDFTMSQVVAFFKTYYSLDSNQCQKVHVYHGSLTECKYKLMQNGIPVNDLPLTDEGELKTENHLQWLERRKQFEQEQLMKVKTWA